MIYAHHWILYCAILDSGIPRNMRCLQVQIMMNACFLFCHINFLQQMKIYRNLVLLFFQNNIELLDGGEYEQLRYKHRCYLGFDQ